MTGEITLRGAVLPVGGIKEKVLAAHRAGIKKVLVPHRNEQAISEVPADVLTQLEIKFIDTVEEALNESLGLQLFRSNTNDLLLRQQVPAA